MQVSEFAFMGGNDVKLGESEPDPGGPTIHMKMVSIMGGSSLVRGRKLGKRQFRGRQQKDDDPRDAHCSQRLVEAGSILSRAPLSSSGST